MAKRAAPEIRDVNWLIDTTRRLGPNGACRTLRINNFTGILHAVEAGVGVGGAARLYRGESRPHLVRVLPDMEGPSFDVHLVYPDALRQSKRVAAFRDFLVKAAKDWRY